MLTSSILNSVIFKNVESNSLPTNWNTLHNNRCVGAFTNLKYWQKFPQGETIYLQFESTSNTDITLKIFNPVLNETQTISYNNDITGDYTRYYFNVALALGTEYYNKDVYITIEQDSYKLTSEPICLIDMADEIANGEMIQIKYTNKDRYNSDLDSYFVDWPSLLSTGDYMQFYIEAVNNETNPVVESTIIEGTLYHKLVSAKYTSGFNLKTGIVPHYMAERLAVSSLVDVIEINGEEGQINGDVEISLIANNLSYETTVSFTTDVQGINVDDLGTNSDMKEYHKFYNQDQVSNFTVTVPAGYYIDKVSIGHNGSSVANLSIVSASESAGGGADLGQLRVYNNGGISDMEISKTLSFTSDKIVYFAITGDAGANIHVAIVHQLSNENFG